MNPVTNAWRAWLDSKLSAKLWEQMRSTLDGCGQIRQDLSNDQLHLLGPGYVIWSRAIAPAVLGS
ncbi:MAG TPA: hypothetical protein VGE22_11875 [Solimonas sp.]